MMPYGGDCYHGIQSGAQCKEPARKAYKPQLHPNSDSLLLLHAPGTHVEADA